MINDYLNARVWVSEVDLEAYGRGVKFNENLKNLKKWNRLVHACEFEMEFSFGNLWKNFQKLGVDSDHSDIWWKLILSYKVSCRKYILDGFNKICNSVCNWEQSSMELLLYKKCYVRKKNPHKVSYNGLSFWKQWKIKFFLFVVPAYRIIMWK